MKPKTAIFSLFLVSFIILALFVPGARAAFEVTEVPTYIDNQLGVGEFIGGLLASLFILMLFLLPTIYLTKGKQASLYIILSLVILAPLIALGWFPVYVYILILLLLALGFGKKITDFLGGIGK